MFFVYVILFSPLPNTHDRKVGRTQRRRANIGFIYLTRRANGFGGAPVTNTYRRRNRFLTKDRLIVKYIRDIYGTIINWKTLSNTLTNWLLSCESCGNSE